MVSRLCLRKRDLHKVRKQMLCRVRIYTNYKQGAKTLKYLFSQFLEDVERDDPFGAVNGILQPKWKLKFMICNKNEQEHMITTNH